MPKNKKQSAKLAAHSTNETMESAIAFFNNHYGPTDTSVINRFHHFKNQFVRNFSSMPQPLLPVQMKQEQQSPGKANFLQNFLLRTNESARENAVQQNGVAYNVASDNRRGGEEEEENRSMDAFDDIHLVESSKSNSNGYISDESHQRFMAAQNVEVALGDGSSNSNSGGGRKTKSPTEGGGKRGGSTTQDFSCLRCGKGYRWKSTLRRHENFECGGKEPSHQCPYCNYKSKQRGNLGVHVRKHHPDKPNLTSKRRSKFSVKAEASAKESAPEQTSQLAIEAPPQIKPEPMSNGAAV